MTKFVYSFSEGNKDMRELLGGKGANLAEMTNIGLPVPRGFTVTTEACNQYYADGEKISETVEKEIFEKLAELESITGKKLGDLKNPLLVSVRSGSRASMPGMMDTVLNLGLNDEVAKGFAEETKNPRFIYDSYRRFIMMFADVVKGYPKNSFDRILDDMKQAKGVKQDTELTAEDMMELTEKFKDIYKELSGVDFPQDPKVQLLEAVKAVFRSWNNERAIIYRRMNDIPSSWGTAVNVQEMVYGNRGDDCGTGVAFSRNPATGENKIFGEYLMNAQGEDVVAGIRTPQPIETLKETDMEAYQDFVMYANKLEKHYKDMQDMEFTIENGKLYFLQTRNGKRTATAALQIAVDLVNEGMITEKEAVLRVEPNQLDQLLHPNFDQEKLKKAKVIAKGLAASPGAATGKVVFTAEDALEKHKNGEIYLQSLSSMIPPIVLSPKEDENILDMAAAPGGKTTQMLALSQNKAYITACEKNKIRAERLQYNLNKQDANRVNVMIKDARQLDDFFSFDKILLDAPCSGSGTISIFDKKLEATFTEDLVNRSSKVQADLLKKAITLLKSGHEMVYSTCSILSKENEEILQKFIKLKKVEVIPIDTLPFSDAIFLPTSIKGTLCICPSKLFEGFYVAKLRKL